MKKIGVDPAVEKAVKELLLSAEDFDQRVKAVDRALKLEQLKARIQDDEFGTDFDLSEGE